VRGLCLLVAICVAVGRVGALDLRAMRAAIEAWHSDDARGRFAAWRALVDDLRRHPERDRLRLVNDFFNRTIRFSDDPTVWGQDDYWATPLETLGAGAGDCEDFAIAKYFTLLESGVPVHRLRLIYVLAHVGVDGSTTVAHMVLAYFERPDADPLVLDSLTGDILPGAARPDLDPVYSFNGSGVWYGAASSPTPVDRLSRWQDVLIKMHREGYEF
jgi:predicted transglutaminase-like cysteine proteinase